MRCSKVYSSCQRLCIAAMEFGLAYNSYKLRLTVSIVVSTAFACHSANSGYSILRTCTGIITTTVVPLLHVY